MEFHMLPKSTASAIFDSVHDLMDTYELNIQRLQAMGVDYQSDLVLSEMLHFESHYKNVTSFISSDRKFQKMLWKNSKSGVSIAYLYKSFAIR